MLCQLPARHSSWRVTFGIGAAVAISSLMVAGCRRESSTSQRDEEPFSPSSDVIEMHNQAVALMGRFEYGKAHEVLTTIVSNHPAWVASKIDLAIATLNRQQAGDSELAAEILDEILADHLDDPRAAYCRALLYRYDGESEQALALFNAVASRDPRDGYASFFAGQCLMDVQRVEDAFNRFQEAIQREPYLRSAYYGAFQAAQRLGRGEDAQDYFQQFQKLGTNPQARVAEIKYTRMGPKAEVHPLVVAMETSTRPAGAVFLPETSLNIVNGGDAHWRNDIDQGRFPNITVCDLNGDGHLDLFVSKALVGEDTPNAVLINQGDGFKLEQQHVLASVSDVNAALWGDYDNDGLTDVYFCRPGENQLWRQSRLNMWEDVTQSTNTGGGEANTVDGAIFDADHDGDLDLFLINSDSRNELLSNNLDGTFRQLGQELGIAVSNVASRGIVIADLDGDRDTDIVVINEDAPHEVYLNDRLWAYRAATGFDLFRQSRGLAAVAVDSDADGQVEIITLSSNRILSWQPSEDDVWSSRVLVAHSGVESNPIGAPLAIADVDGDGTIELLFSNGGSLSALGLHTSARVELDPSKDVLLINWSVANFDSRHGPSIVGLRAGLPPTL